MEQHGIKTWPGLGDTQARGTCSDTQPHGTQAPSVDSRSHGHTAWTTDTRPTQRRHISQSLCGVPPARAPEFGGAPGHVGWGEVATPAAVLAWGPDPDPGTPHPPRVWGLGWVFVAAYGTYWLEGHPAFQRLFYDGGGGHPLPFPRPSRELPLRLPVHPVSKGAETPRTPSVWTAGPAQLLLVAL